jgi:60 kDa SS-A/Ro ribonucleoprotein
MQSIWNRLERFLVLGSDRGTYYVAEPVRGQEPVDAALKTDGERTVAMIGKIASSGRAPRRDPMLLALAMAAAPALADRKTNAIALAALPLIALTAIDLYKFAGFARRFRGWGRALRAAVSEWYRGKPAGELARSMLKTGGGEGWAHRDLLRMAHPQPPTVAHNTLFRWAVEGELSRFAPVDVVTGELKAVYAFEMARRATSEQEAARVVEDYGLTCEEVPPRWRQSPLVWEALLDHMPYRDMLRHLGDLARAGLLDQGSETAALVTARIGNRARVRSSGVHPVDVWAASVAYRADSPSRPVLDSLEDAYRHAMGNVRPVGAPLHVAVDASPSMEARGVAEAAEVMAEVYSRTERRVTVTRFAGRFERAEAETIVMFTDARRFPPSGAVKTAVVAMAATEALAGPPSFSQLGVAGFDQTVPAVLEDFLGGRVSAREGLQPVVRGVSAQLGGGRLGLL